MAAMPDEQILLTLESSLKDMEKSDSAKGSPPSQQQDQPGSFLLANMRWFNIGARTLHIGLAAVLFGGFVLAVPFVRLETYHWLAIVSGIVLMALEWRHDYRWWHRGKGLLVWLHTGLCLLIHLLPQFTIPLLWLILISGCIGSHMPRRYRHWSIRDGWEKRGENDLSM
jgi:hypothetical protein